MILTFPNVTPNANNFGMVSSAQTTKSELNGAIQTLALPGDIWTDTLTYTNVFDPDARIMRAFLSRLRGEAGRFYYSPFGYRRAGSALGSPLVKGANQTGLSLLTDGWSPNQTGALLAGDYFQVGNELKMLAVDASADSGGNATLTFTSPLRTSPADNAQIVTTKPCCVMKLVDGNQARWQAQPTPIFAMSISCMEALDL